MITFALTGGIGSGKSSVAALFARFGVPVIDADHMARAAVAPGTEALAEIVRQFGALMVTPDGTLDRGRLGRLVFSDPEARSRLNAIVHPEVRKMVELEQARLERAGHALACYDVPLLFETAQQDKYRPVLVVTANDEVRLERIMRRDGLDRAAAEARLRAQIPLAEKAKWADIVLVNNGSWDDLERNAARALDEVRAWK